MPKSEEEQDPALGELRPLRVGFDRARRLVVVDAGGGVFAMDVMQALHMAKMLLHNAQLCLHPPAEEGPPRPKLVVDGIMGAQ